LVVPGHLIQQPSLQSKKAAWTGRLVLICWKRNSGRGAMHHAGALIGTVDRFD
jgi:hypothetical protein